MTKLAVLEGFDQEAFLNRYWGRSPCLIRDWLRPTPLAVERLLALAEAQELPARLVEGTSEDEDWSVRHGPLLADDLPETEDNWTLLVQEVDKAEPAVAALLDQFRFLPHWILDDVMISHAVPGGSVGPHKDAYDVFLVQVDGARRWELSTRDPFEADERFELALIADWCPEETVRTEPGDVLYLPPGVGHHGVAQSTCQTWSVGLRTPSGPELMFQLAETLMDRTGHAGRLRVDSIDPSAPDRISIELIGQARTLLQQGLALDDDALGSMLAGFLTRWRLWPNDDLIELETITRLLRAGHPVRLAATARLALLGEGQLFVNGESIDCPPALAIELSRTRALSPAWLEHAASIDALLESAAIERPAGPSVVR